MEDVLRDKRFAHIGKDPRFRNQGRKQRKVKIDKRFQGMFNDSKFQLKYSVDKRGRPVNTTSAENLKKFYELTSDEYDSDNTESLVDKKEKKVSTDMKKDQSNTEKDLCDIKSRNSSVKTCDVKSTKNQPSGDSSDNDSSKEESSDDESSEDEDLDRDRDEDAESESDEDPDRERDEDAESESNDDSESEIDQEEIDPVGVDYARGAAFMESSSDDSDADEDNQVAIDHKWGEIDKEAPTAEEVTHRLAVCNLDWDRINADDIMVLLDSFKPTGGIVKAVKIYPSEFGKSRMKSEEVTGPTEFVESSNKTMGGLKEEEYNREVLRQYQMNRLKYYYAVAECDSSQTANHIYEACDGLEYLSSGNKIDLRFIPNDMTFNEEEAKCTATVVPDTSSYKPKEFVNTALQQSTVDCTWDETDPNRLAVTMRKFDKDDLEDMDLKDYLASNSEAEEENPYGTLIDASGFEEIASASEDEEEHINKYKNLLKDLDQSKNTEDADNDVHMEITWEPGLKEAAEEIVKKQTKEKDATPWEKFLDKKKEKRKQKKEISRLKNEKTEEQDSDDSDVPEGVDLNDPYFKEELDKMNANTEMDSLKPRKTGKTSKKKKHIKEKELNPEELKEKEEQQAQLKLLLLDEDDHKQHFNLKSLMESDKKKKRKMKKALKKKTGDEDEMMEDNFKLDVEDPRFSVLFENPLYNIDPSAPEFKKTKAMDELVEEKVKRAKKHKRKGSKTEKLESKDDTSEPKKKVQKGEFDKNTDYKKNIDLASIVKSIKTNVANRKMNK